MSLNWTNLFAWGGGVVTLLGGSSSAVAFARRRKRYKARDCNNCQHSLERLDELADDGERSEEYLKSVDYDIWHCANCNEYEFHRYPAMFSPYKDCPDCKYRTVDVSSQMLIASTCDSGGKKEITEICQRASCDYGIMRVVNTPRRNCSDDNDWASSSSSFSSSSSSSSSSGSFGGGSSSGGGSSGSW